ncbi:MAG: YggS family pyridoxal phosphate-dependent enzyme [Eggerthellaceae bacterium]|nr:YggS family pyridoxal phosphate-dependent enzyme [Eggerthellaceae bacterium]
MSAMNSLNSLKSHYGAFVDEVQQCCLEYHRTPDDVRIVAVSKTVGVDVVAQGIEAGIRDFGENRPDDLTLKGQAFPDRTWHFIGNIQSRKIPAIVAQADLIHSLYQAHHIELLEKSAASLGKVQKVLLEVNVAREANKQGLAPQELAGMLEQCSAQPHIQVCGLMTMAPQGDLIQAQECFENLAELAQNMRKSLSNVLVEQEFRELSMGMSEDWRPALAAGATIIRIGRLIFDDTYRT